MKWTECKSESEKREALRSALCEHPTVTAAARALGINRQYLYELLPRYAPDMTATPDIPDVVGPTDSVGSSPTVGLTVVGSLTYSRRRSTFRSVENAATADIVRTAIDLPKNWLDWLEREALRRKQAGRMSRPAKSPVVIEALEMLRNRIEREDEDVRGTERGKP
jgi:hypothetical protein